ncbi:glycosyltransferase family 39 protein [Candidatus Dependentiae bacterium]|nr:glycosyltransferase family 39 protein [Candidatus Dependentiae bacterium]
MKCVNKKKLYVFILGLIVLFSIYIRISGLDKYPGINADESWMANKAYYIHTTSILENLGGMNNYTGLLTPAFMNYWGKLFGFTHYSMRLLSVFFSLITIILTYIICFFLFSKAVSVISCLLLSSSIFFICYSKIATPHVWITSFLLISYFLLNHFINTGRTKKYILIIIILLVAFAVQLNPAPILFFVFMFFVLIDKQSILKFYKNKYFPLFIIIFILGTSSMFFYTFKIIINIVKMNYDYLASLGFYNVAAKMLYRIPVYFEVLFLTVSGWRSIIYFSGFPAESYKIVFLISGIIFVSPVFFLYKSKDKNDMLIFYYILIHILVMPFFLEFFNRNMHFPLLGEERYFMVLYPFIIIGAVRGWEFFFNKYNYRKIFYMSAAVYFIIILIVFKSMYADVFEKTGGGDGESLVRKVYAVNEKPVIEEVWQYLNENYKNELDNSVFIAPSFWTYHPLKFCSLDKIKNLYFWPEKQIPEIWITDKNKMQYKFATIGWFEFFKYFYNKNIYLITFTDSSENYYLNRLKELSVSYDVIKTFYKKNNAAILKLYRIKSN